MATTFIMVRHGFSLANQQSRFAGHWDIPLAELGHKQAQAAAEYLEKLPIDVLYSSDLLRAYQTAEPLALKLGLPIRKDPQFREIFAGDWEGKTVAELWEEYPAEFSCWAEDIGRSRCCGGESVAELYRRINAEVDRVAAAHEGQTVCVTIHAVPIRAMCTRCAGLPAAEMQQVPWVANASINIFEWEKGILRAVETDITTHLEGLEVNHPRV